MQVGPQLLFGDARAERSAHSCNSVVTGRHCEVDRRDLFGCLNDLGPVGHGLSVNDVDAVTFQRLESGWVEAVDSESSTSRRARAEQGNNLLGPISGELVDSGAGNEVVPADGVADFGDVVVPVGEVLAALEIEQYDRSLHGDVRVSTRVVQGVDLHIRRAGRVADVDRIIEHTGITVGGGERRAEPVQSTRLQGSGAGCSGAGCSGVGRSGVGRGGRHNISPSLDSSLDCSATRWASVTRP